MKKLLLITAALVISQSALAHHNEHHRPQGYYYTDVCRHHCGVVESVMPMTIPETIWSYMGPIAGGRYVTVFRVSARMNDGTMRYVDYSYHPGLHAGMPVIFQGGTLHRR